MGRFSPFAWLLFLFYGRYTETNLLDILMTCLLWQLKKNQEKQSQSEGVIHGLVEFPEILNKFSRQWGLIFFKYSLRLHHKISMPQFYIMMSKQKDKKTFSKHKTRNKTAHEIRHGKLQLTWQYAFVRSMIGT